MLTPTELASLRSLPASERRELLLDISEENEQLAAQLAAELEHDQYTTNDKRWVADFFGVSIDTVNAWQSKGMPYVARGKGVKGEYDVRECVQWYVEYKSSSDSTPTSVEAAAAAAFREEKTKTARLKREQLEGTLVSKAEFERKLTTAMGIIRSGADKLLKAFGNDAADILESICDEAERELFDSGD